MNNIFSKIYTLRPVNKTAAIQINQSECKGILNTAQKLDNALLAKSAIMDSKNKVHEEVRIEGYNLKVINTEISRLRFVLGNERVSKGVEIYKEQQAWARNKKAMVIKASTNETTLIHVELKKILKAQMPFDKYVILMKQATINAGVERKNDK
jgi:hypothetical protein